MQYQQNQSQVSNTQNRLGQGPGPRKCFVEKMLSDFDENEKRLYFGSAESLSEVSK